MTKNLGKKVLLVESDRDQLLRLKDYISRMNSFSDYEIAFDGNKAVEIALSMKPDLVITSLLLSGRDGLAVAEAVRNDLPDTGIIVCSSVQTDFLIKSAFSVGADMFFRKPFDFYTFQSHVTELLFDRARCNGMVVCGDSYFKQLMSAITREILKIGLSAGIKGFKYVRYAIYTYIQLYPNTSTMNIIYPAVAKKFDTNVSCVERNIRHAIECAWVQGSISYIDDVFGFTVDADKGKPTNSAFIATIAERVRLQMSDE